MMLKKPLSLLALLSALAFSIPYVQGADSLQPKETGYSDTQSTKTSTLGITTASTSLSVAEKSHPTETRLTIPSWLKSQDEAVYQRFVNGALIYQPNPNSDDGKIVLPISALGNPLDGTFDLSKCGDMSKHLIISTGYYKEKPQDTGKIRIWFTPRFLIEKALNTTGKHFQWIYSNWKENAPIGIFWTWRGWWDSPRLYRDYLTTQNMDEISGNLYKKWLVVSAWNEFRFRDEEARPDLSASQKLYVHF